ncbi:sodium-dependent bicarbonate transport family permease [Clostridiaceae bacterium 35-E11]
MISLEFALNNMLSPSVLFFVLGVIAVLVKSDLEIPNSIGKAITLFILISIGLKGGIAVNKTGVAGVIIPALSAVFIGILITTLVYFIMCKIGFDSANAGSIAGHYGACSSVTLTTVLVFLEQIGASFEEFVPALYPFMDTSALITGIILGSIGLKKNSAQVENGEYGALYILRTSITAKSTLLIFGSFLIGLISGAEGAKSIMPFYDNLFKGVFTIFMLDIGLLAGSRIFELKDIKPLTFILAVILPPFQAVMAIILATFIGLSPGGATVFAALAAGASYITAPAVMRSTFPDANPSLGLGMSLGIIFPFNILIGIPLYYQIANIISKLL